MDVQLRFSMRGMQQVTNHLDRLLQRARHAEPVLRRAADYMVRSTQHRLYQSKVDPDNRPWAELSDETYFRRMRSGDRTPDNILVHTGRLARSIRVDGVGDSDFRIVADPRDRRGRSYAGYHQTGTGYMPERPFMGFSQTNINRITTMMRQYIAGNEIAEGFDE